MVASIEYRTNIMRRDNASSASSSSEGEGAQRRRFFDAIQKRMVEDVSIDDLYGSLMAKEDAVLTALNNVADAAKVPADTSTSRQMWTLTRKAVAATFQVMQLTIDRDFTTLWGLVYSDHEFRIALGMAMIAVAMCVATVLLT